MITDDQMIHAVILCIGLGFGVMFGVWSVTREEISMNCHGMTVAFTWGETVGLALLSPIWIPCVLLIAGVSWMVENWRAHVKATAVLAAVMMLTGCAQFASKGGVMGAVQTADEALAAKYGIPKSAVVSVRKALGIPDARTLPNSNEVLPKGYVWHYELLDATGKAVDPSAFHWGTFPVVTPVTALPTNVFTTTAPPIDSLEGILKLLQDNPDLLKEVPK